jgi:hypothetical protein
MSMNTGYVPLPLAPQIFIHDINTAEPHNEGNADYVYQTSQIDPSPTQDFSLRALKLHCGVNDDVANAVMLIDDPDGNLIEPTGRSDCKIKRQWRVQIYLGKTSANLNRWFYGLVIDADVIRPTTNMQQVRILCAGWGERLKRRVTQIKRFQKKSNADGLTLDDTDTNAKVSEVIKDIVADSDHYVDSGQPTESAITTFGVQDIDIKLADFQQVGQTWASSCSQLAGYANAHWGIDADRDLYLIKPMSASSGFLMTNDPASSDAVGWDVDKLAYLLNSPLQWVDSTADSALSVLHGMGAHVHTLVQDSNPASPNSTFNLKDGYLAIEFIPNADNLEKIALSLNKNGTPSLKGDLTVFLCGEDNNNIGFPSLDQNLRAKGTLHSSKLDAIPTSGRGWTEIGFNVTGGVITPSQEKLWIVVKKFGDATNGLVVERHTTGGENFTTSSTGADGSWAANSTDDFLFRVYANNPIIITLEDVSAVNKWGVREGIFSFRQNIQEETAREAIIAASETIGREKRLYQNIKVSPFTDRLPLGKTIRIHDSLSGLDTEADVIGIDVSMTSGGESNLGATEVLLTLEESTF